ncbi:MAG TPA: hypothetical protein PKA64_21000 [Myxococcota bacterium]|nr:hypothetical protein [Myxococcota bacterium]
MRAPFVILPALLYASAAHADIDPKCQDIPRPDDYDEQVQGDFQANYFALASSQSPMHAAIPHEPGHGSIGVDAKVIPGLTCDQRYVLNWTKTEQTNKSPMLPQISASFAFPAIKDIAVPYAGFSVLPALPFGDPYNAKGSGDLPVCDGTVPLTECRRRTRNLVISGEIGVGFRIHPRFEAGLRGHVTTIRTLGDIATAFDPETEPSVEDIYQASTWGIDVLAGVPIEVGKQKLTPYAAVGYLDASTQFFVGDDSYYANNLHPYAGAAFSVGLDTLLMKHLRLAAEFYGAPGGYSTPDKTVESVDQGSRYGHLYTARARIGVEF